MERVRITVDQGDLSLSPIYGALAGESGVERAQIVNWNVSEPPTGFLLRVRGEYERLESILDGDPDVSDHEFLPLGGREGYCFLEGAATSGERALFENFTRGSLLTVPLVVINDDATSTFTLIGNRADLQAAVEDVPAPVDVEVEAVGGERVATDSVVGALSPRQREAIEVGLDLGYYDVPREVTVDDVAEELGCATATAAEHLRKAEGKVLSSLFGER